MRVHETPRNRAAAQAAAHRTRAHALARVAKTALLAALLATLALCCGCRPTDFFTEIIISPFADEVDEDNPEKTIVNSPDAEEESDMLSALDWSDDAVRSEQVQNLVTYSDDPTSTLLAHHSIFSLNPRFTGILSSDAVTLDYSVPSTVENESSPQPTESDMSADDNPELEGSEATEQGATDTPTGASEEGEVQQPDVEAPGEGEGQTGNPTDGMDGTVSVYDPNNAFSEVQHADRLAATGQAAVLVQMIGGEGALCAMDEATYHGTGATASSFSEVFADELADDFADTALLWTGTGTQANQLTDIEALVEACGQNGVIVYDQSEGSYDTRFNLDQRKYLQAYNIQLVPVDFSSVQGMIDAAAVVGDALSESSYTSVAKENADKYADAIDSIVRAVAASHGGSLAAKDESSSGSRLLSSYNSCPVGGYTSNHLFCAFGTTYIQGISYANGSFSIDTTTGLLFARTDGESPLSFWAQAAGVWDRAADLENDGASRYSMVYGIEAGAYFDSGFFSAAAGTASSVLNACKQALLLSTNDSSTGVSGSTRFGDGLGSGAFPYLIVSASNGKTAQQVKQSVVSQISSQDPLNAYSALPWSGNSFSATDANGNLIETVVGSSATKQVNAFTDQGVNAADSVRANPEGLLGSWTEGSAECVLEAAWLARIYSGAPANSDYSPICNYSASQLRQTVSDFYSTFYRIDDADAAYASVVTDEGL